MLLSKTFYLLNNVLTVNHFMEIILLIIHVKQDNDESREEELSTENVPKNHIKTK